MENETAPQTVEDEKKKIREFYDPPPLYDNIKQRLANIKGHARQYYYINRDLISQAIKLGISKEVKEVLEGFLIKKRTKLTDQGIICYCEDDEKLFESTVTYDVFNAAIPDTTRTLLLPVFPPQTGL